MEMQRRQDEVCTERTAQIRTRREAQQMQQDEDRMFDKLWESDRLAKEERENQELQRQRQNNLQQVAFLQAQMETAEQQRIRAKQLKEEEAELLVQYRSFNALIS